MTQTERLLDYLKRGKKITTLEAITELGILRLASRIHDLKKATWDIQDAWRTGEAKYGGTYQIKEYWLELRQEENNGQGVML